MGDRIWIRLKYLIFILLSTLSISKSQENDILGCGGFVKSHVNLDISNIEIGLYTKEGSLVEKTECAPTNGYYFLPLYEKGDYVLKVDPPAGWSFEPSQVELSVDGENDQCSKGQDINFSFNGFGITGKVITAGQKEGPAGISVQLVNDKGEVRNTVTTLGGDFHFTPVIPGKYVLKASHSRWKLEPSQANVVVKEGNTVLPSGVLAVKGYDVSGSITSFGSPISGIYVLLYSKEENPKFRVEGCNTALLQGVPDSPICHSITDTLGEFNFGLVPAGDYKLVALAKSPGQNTVSFNVKPDKVDFSVKHDSQYIKNAFEVNGFNVVGSALATKGGKPVSGAQVLLGGQAVGTTDSAGKFTLTSLKPGTYSINLQHEECEWDEWELRVGGSGVSGVTAVAARWRVCGSVSPPRRVSLTPHAGAALYVDAAADGNWCTFLPPGTYTAKVEVSEQEQRDGMQFFPERQQVSVGGAAAGGVSFSQLRAEVSGRVLCARCPALRVELRHLAPDGSYVGEPLYADVDENGAYTLSGVAAGSVSVRVGGASAALCWREAAHNVAVAAERAVVPDLVATGRRLHVVSTHDIEVQYTSGEESGTLSVPAGTSAQCLKRAARYTLTPVSCHRVEPASVDVTLTPGADVPVVEFRAVSHAATVRITSEAAGDVALRVSGRDGDVTLPLQPLHDYVYEHTLYLAEGEEVLLRPQSSSLLFRPREARAVGAGACGAAATFTAAPGVVRAGRLLPPVAGATVTLTADDLKLTQVTKEDGTYRFGPLESGKRYTVRADLESYEFDEPDDNGDIRAHKLADIDVLLVDDADDTPLEGALVSVSGGAYRRTAASGAGGRLRFGALPPAQYYVKANMKEYRFAPPHRIVDVRAPPHPPPDAVVFRGSRVAWSVSGVARALGGAGAALGVRARPPPALAARCAALDASAGPDGHFRIRGLVPTCQYTLELKESTTPELAGARLLRAPPVVEVQGKDIEGVELIVHLPTSVTDVTALITAPPEHFRTLRLTLTLATSAGGSSGTAVHSARLDSAGAASVMYALPRLPADNRSYVLALESSLSRLTHAYEEPVVYFNADGQVKHFDLVFEPNVVSSDQELRASSWALAALAGVGALLWAQRDRVLAALAPRPDARRLARRKP